MQDIEHTMNMYANGQTISQALTISFLNHIANQLSARIFSPNHHISMFVTCFETPRQIRMGRNVGRRLEVSSAAKARLYRGRPDRTPMDRCELTLKAAMNGTYANQFGSKFPNNQIINKKTSLIDLQSKPAITRDEEDQWQISISKVERPGKLDSKSQIIAECNQHTASTRYTNYAAL